jgi:DinB superfamily
MVDAHDDRIDRMCRAYRDAHCRFVERLARVPAERAEAAPAEGGWSAAQVGWHVAAVDAVFAGLLSGDRPSQRLADDFRKRDWSEVAAAIPPTLEASRAVMPPPDVRYGDALSALAESSAKLERALRALTPDRGAQFGVTHRAIGTVTLYQLGEWATAHTIRHNVQAKRILQG